MRWQNTYIAAVGSWVPAPSPARDAVEAGLLDPERFKQLGYESLCIADDVAPPDMAVRAGETALARSGLSSRASMTPLHQTSGGSRRQLKFVDIGRELALWIGYPPRAPQAPLL